jgi:hypothetical protein
MSCVPDDLSSRQLSALALVAERLDEAGIEYWLFGGWAVDFYAGAVTRPHDDVDIGVWLEDAERVAELLVTAGWDHAPEDDEEGGTGYERGGVRVELTFLARDGAERVVTPMRHGSAIWPDGTFRGDVRELHGVQARLIALPALVQGKASAREDPEEAAKDGADFETLSGGS